jgi:hypothetical protein
MAKALQEYPFWALYDWSVSTLTTSTLAGLYYGLDSGYRRNRKAGGMLNGALNKKIAAQFAKLQREVLPEVKKQIPIAARKAQISVRFLQLMVASLINAQRENGTPKEVAAALIQKAVEKVEAMEIAFMQSIK